MKQSDAQILGRKGQRWFESKIPQEWVFQRPSEDFGFDGVVVIGDEGELNGIEFKVQIKASRVWKRLEKALLLQGVKRRTVRDWMAAFARTLMVLYEESTDSGYIWWVADLFPTAKHLRHLFLDTSETMSLRIPADIKVEPECWDKVRERLARDHKHLINTLQLARVSHDLLPLVRTLAESFRGLYMAQQSWRDADDDDKQKVLLLLEAVSHRDAIIALKQFRETLPADLMLTRNIDTILEFYTQRLDLFYHGYETMFSGTTTAFWANEKALIEQRPSMLQFGVELISRFAGIVNGQPTRNSERPITLPEVSLFGT